jgi:hypothetical protein
MGSRSWWLRSRLGVTGAAALVILAATLVALAVLERRGAGTEVAALVEHAAEQRRGPVELIVSGARAHRLVFLGDVHGAAEPKRLAARAIEELARHVGLDAIVLEVDRELQPIIDRYLDSNPEDAALLLANPRTVDEAAGTGREMLELYRTVWRLNRELGADRRIRVVAADLAGWPSARALSPRDAAQLYGQRDSAMAEHVQRQVFTWDARARALFFVDGYRVLRDGEGLLQTGGGAPTTVRWLAARMADEHQGQVYSILVDGSPRRTAPVRVAGFQASRLYDIFRRELPGTAAFGLRIGQEFDFLRRPIHATSGSGLSLELLPRDYRLRDVVDGYIHPGTRGGGRTR